jgi:WhiB family redox-sensing transcriptional regulator
MPHRVLFPTPFGERVGPARSNCGPLATGEIVRTGHQRLTSLGTVARCRLSVLSCLLRETGDPGILVYRAADRTTHRRRRGAESGHRHGGRQGVQSVRQVRMPCLHLAGAVTRVGGLGWGASSAERTAPEMAWVEDWTIAAGCRGMDPDELFVQGAAQNRAKVVCATCPVRTECLADALDNRVEYGVWGGMTERERRALLRKRPEVRFLAAGARGGAGRLSGADRDRAARPEPSIALPRQRDCMEVEMAEGLGGALRAGTRRQRAERRSLRKRPPRRSREQAEARAGTASPPRPSSVRHDPRTAQHPTEVGSEAVNKNEQQTPDNEGPRTRRAPPPPLPR